MTDTWVDFAIDKACDSAFPLLDELDKTKEMGEADLINALMDDFGCSYNFAERILGAWQIEKENRNKSTHSVDVNSMKILNTFIKEVL